MRGLIYSVMKCHIAAPFTKRFFFLFSDGILECVAALRVLN